MAKIDRLNQVASVDVSLPVADLSSSTSRQLESDPRRVGQVAVRMMPIASESGTVRELEVNVLNAGTHPHVTACSATIPVPTPTELPTNVTLQIVKQPSEPPVNLQITKVPKGPVVLYNAYGNGKGYYFDLLRKHQDTLQEIFYDVKQHCLNSGEMPGNAIGFTINWSKRVVRFYDPSIGHTRELDLDKIMGSNPEINNKAVEAEELISAEINKGDIRNYKFALNNEGALNGAAPLYRANQALQGLPKSTGDQAYKAAMSLSSDVLTDDAQRDAAIHRMGKAETIIKKTKDKVAEEKARLIPLQAAEQDPTRRTQLQKTIAELKDLENRLNSIDTFALYSALAFYPPGADPRPEEVYLRAQMLQRRAAVQLEQERLQAIADGTKKSWIPKWVPVINRLRGEPKIEESRFYPIDVAGLMFSGLELPEARSRYTDHCRTHNVPCKGDGLEDALLREVLRPGSTARGENQALENLLDNITDLALKGTLAAEMNEAMISAHTSAPFTLNGADPSARVDDFRQQASL